MASRRFASRLPLLALVVAAHLGALLLLVILTHKQRVPRVEESPLLVMLLAPVVSPALRPQPPPHGRDTTRSQRTNALQPEARAPLAPAASEKSPTIDWAAEGHAAVEQQIEEDERTRRHGGALGPRHSDAFASPKRKPEFHWDYARTHRVEPLSGGIGVAVHLNDHCALILFWLIPMAGCTVGKIPVRGDLFEHMRDPPGSGEWKER
jgi:hypothetical protein